jgi:hypothetical protein
MNDLEQPVSGEELEFDITARRKPSQQSFPRTNQPYSPLSHDTRHLDPKSQHNWQQRKQHRQKHRRQHTLDDAQSDLGNPTDPGQPARGRAEGIDVGDTADKGDGDGPDDDEADGECPRDDAADLALVRVLRGVVPFDVLRDDLRSLISSVLHLEARLRTSIPLLINFLSFSLLTHRANVCASAWLLNLKNATLPNSN